MNIFSYRTLRSILTTSNIKSFSTTTVKDVEVRVRFAPSPTGNIHLGGLRTALYNYIFAKQNEGKFILRIEDTDQTRIVPGSADGIEDILDWAGIQPDESPRLGGNYGPYNQSARLDLYKQKANELLECGKAYRCFCSHERLDLMRKFQARNREKPRYDGSCRNLSPKEVEDKLIEENGRYVVRFALMPGQTVFEDLVFGIHSSDLVESMESDPIILKSDQYPTYHFANVVDDHEMRISHVLRGSEWIASTAKHIQLYQAFNWDEPKFAHFPLITLRDGSKLSKRNNETHIKSWQEAGYRPLAVLNFLTNMGGGLPKDKQDSLECWDLPKLVGNFDFNKIIRHPGSVDLNKMRLYNSNDLKQTWRENPAKIIDQFHALLHQANIKTDLDDNILGTIMNQFIDRITTLNDLLASENRFVWWHQPLTWSPQEYQDMGWNLKKLVEDVIQVVIESDIDDTPLLNQKLKALASEHNIDWPSLMMFIRKVLTNNHKGLPVYEIFNCLGKKRLLVYLNEGLKYVG